MKKLTRGLSFLSTLGVMLASVQVAYAQTVCPRGQFTVLCTLNLASGNLVGNIVAILLVLAIIVSLFFFVWGGVRWISSGGDKAKIEHARSTVIAALIGLIIALAAFFFLSVIITFFTGSGLRTLSIPRLVP